MRLLISVLALALALAFTQARAALATLSPFNPSQANGLCGIGHDDLAGNTGVAGTDGDAWLLGRAPCQPIAAAPEAAPRPVSLVARPNPARGRVTLLYSLAAGSPVEIDIHDVAGRRIRTWVEGLKPAGPHESVWNGRDGAGTRVCPGVYFYSVRAGASRARGSVVILN